MNNELVPVKGLVKVVTTESAWDLGKDGVFTIVSPCNLWFKESVQYAIDRGCVPTTLDDGAALIDRLEGKDNALSYTVHAGTLTVQTYENGQSKIRVIQPKEYEFWKLFVQEIPENANYVDVIVKKGFGKTLVDMCTPNATFLVPEQDLNIPFANTQYETDSIVKIMLPINSSRFVRAIQREYPKRTYGKVLFSRPNLEEGIARVGPFGLGLDYFGNICVVIANVRYGNGRARGKLPVVPQK